MCNLYNITTSQQAILQWTRAITLGARRSFRNELASGPGELPCRPQTHRSAHLVPDLMRLWARRNRVESRYPCILPSAIQSC